MILLIIAPKRIKYLGIKEQKQWEACTLQTTNTCENKLKMKQKEKDIYVHGQEDLIKIPGALFCRNWQADPKYGNASDPEESKPSGKKNKVGGLSFPVGNNPTIYQQTNG